MKNTEIHYYLGLILGAKYRKWYCRKYNNRWLWGMNKAIKESSKTEIKNSNISLSDLNDMLEVLNSNRKEKSKSGTQK